MHVVHIGNLPLTPSHPDFGRIVLHPGRWVLNLAIAQNVHAEIIPEIVVQVPGTHANHVAEWDGIKIHYLAAPDRLRAASLFWFDAQRISRYVRRIQPNIVHAHGTEDAYGLAAQHTGLPHALTAQGAFFLINRILKPRLLSRASVVGFTEYLCLRRERHVIAKSDYVGNALKRQFPHLTIHRIANTIDARLGEISEKKGKNNLVFVGTIDQRKGVDIILRAIEIAQQSVPEIRLSVIGNRGNKASPYEINLIERLRSLMGERLVLHGIIANLEVAKKVASSNVLLAPSREEMFGNQLIEALAVGTHAIVTDQTAMAENVRRYGGGTVVPQENPECLADAILQSLSRPDDVNLRANTRRLVLNDLAPKQIAKKHEELYQKILG